MKCSGSESIPTSDTNSRGENLKNPMDRNEQETSGLLLGSDPIDDIRYRASGDKKDGILGDKGDDDSTDSDKTDTDGTDQGDTDGGDSDGKD